MCTSPNRVFFWNARDGTTSTKFTYGEKVDHLEFDSAGHIKLAYDPNTVESCYKKVTNYYTVGCGLCMECRLKRAKERSERMIMETITQGTNNCWFVTLTYNDEQLLMNCMKHNVVTLDGEIIDSLSLNKRDVQLFIKKLRKELFGNDKGDLRYVAVGEYGDKNLRPHYHIIFWNLPIDDLKLDNELTQTGEVQYCSEWLEKKWEHGRVRISPAEAGSIAYTARYVQKKLYADEGIYYAERDIEPPFILQSKGIGKEYLIKNKDRFLEYGKIHESFNGESVELHPDRYFRKLNPDLEDIFKNQNEEFAIQREESLKQKLDQISIDYDDYQRKRDLQLSDRTKSLKRDL